MVNLQNTQKCYGWLSIGLHWLSAIIIFGLFFLGYWMVELDYYSEWYKKAPDLHRSIGLCLLIILLVRLAWRLQQTKPQPLNTHAPFEKSVAHWVHIILYSILFVIMISGYLISTADGRGIMFFELFEVPGFGSIIENQEDIAGIIHEYMAYVMMAVVALHLAGALKHHFVDKDETLRRMIYPSE